VRAAPITIKRPDPETGEVIEEQVSADRFKPKLPRLPNVDESRITLIKHGNVIGPTGRSVIYMIDHREAEIAYWEAYATSLTREERTQLAGGQATSVLRPIPASWRKGDRVDIASNVEAEVFETEETLKGHRTIFRIVDFRPLLPKRIVGGSSKPRTDDQGYATEVTKKEEERARVDGAYTTSRALAVSDTEDELDDKLHQRLHAEASMANAMKGAKRRVRVSKLQLEQRLADARKKHRRSTVRYLERQIASMEDKQEMPPRAAA
jgi:hypothetical protein